MIYPSKTPPEVRDQWATPQYLFDYANEKHNFCVDLAACAMNCKVPTYINRLEDSLTASWHQLGEHGWLNPPYSNIAPWIDKAVLEAKKGFTTTMLIPTPNGETYYKDVLEQELEFIIGRVSFIASMDYSYAKNGKVIEVKKGSAVSGNPRGSVLVTFRPKPNQAVSSVSRNKLQILHGTPDGLDKDFE